MPATRTEVARDEKVAEIVEAAKRRLLAGGFDELSMAGVARDVGVRQNAVYWYFPSRADLFVAALRRIVHDIGARKPRDRRDVVERALWFCDQSAPLQELLPAIREQARESEVVAAFARDLDALLDRMLGNLFRGRVADADLPHAVASFRATVVGAYAQGLSRRERRRLLTYTLERLLGR